jgi:hypothetical protein
VIGGPEAAVVNDEAFLRVPWSAWAEE